MADLAIKNNIFGGDHLCPLCGGEFHTTFGPELFLEGSMQLVCHQCGKDHAPELVHLLHSVQHDAAVILEATH